MNPDLHMADDLKTTGKGNMFVVFGEPDIEIRRLDGDRMEVEVKGIDVFDPNTGDVRSDDTSALPRGSSTPTTTRRASSSATPTSSVPTTPTSR